MSSGVDRDGDGVLDGGEIEARQVVCQGEGPGEPNPPGPPGPAGQSGAPPEPALLSRASRVPAGGACPRGGTVVRAGHDDNGDGVLDDEEIETTDYVCDLAVLTRMRAEPDGANCIGGGIAFLSGADADGDGALDDGEVASVGYECSDVIERDVEVVTSDDLTLLAGVRAIEGDLHVSGPAEVELPGLLRVGGTLSVGGPSAERVSLPALTTVGSQLVVTQTSALRVLELPTLDTVILGAHVRDNDALTDLDLGGLFFVGSELEIRGNAALTQVRLGHYLTMGGEIVVESNAKLGALSLHFSNSIPSVRVEHNAQLASLSVSGPFAFEPAGVPGPLAVRDNAALTEVRLYGESFGPIDVSGNDALETFYESATWSTGDVRVAGASLRRVTLEPLLVGLTYYKLDGDLLIDGPVEALQFGDYLSPGNVSFGAVTLRHVRFENFSAMACCRFGGDLTIEHSERLRQVQVAGLDAGLRLQGNKALDVIAPHPDDGVLRGDLAIVDNATFDGFNFAPGLLDAVEGSVLIGQNPLFDSYWGFQIRSVGGDLRLWQLPALRNMTFDGLAQVAGEVEVRETGLQGWQGLGGLAAAGSLTVADNPALLGIGLPTLATVGDVKVEGNPSLAQLGLGSLKYGDNISFVDNPLLPVCAVEAFFAHVASWSETQSGNNEHGVCP